MLKDRSSRENLCMTALRHRLTRTRTISTFVSPGSSRVPKRRIYSVRALAVPGGGGVRGFMWNGRWPEKIVTSMYELASGKGSLRRHFAKDHDDDGIAGYATPRHVDECEPGALISTHHRRRHQ
jgi:hypothetical protein